jgi:hypothetical protein
MSFATIKRVANPSRFQNLCIKVLPVYFHSLLLFLFVASYLNFSFRGRQCDATEVKAFSIVEEKPDLEDHPAFDVQWLECRLPMCELTNIEWSIYNVAHEWKKESIRKADSPFAQVQHTQA